MLQNVTVVKIAEGKFDLVLEGAKKLADYTRAHDPGNISYQVFRGDKDPNTIVFLEQWESEQALAAHFTTDALHEFDVLITANQVGEAMNCTCNLVY